MRVNVESRKNRILKVIINTYLNSGVPVSSRTICTKSRLGLCSASIRNIMADLEERGYITHLHTSAGRIPTDKGYRFYVDELLENIGLTPQEKIDINKEYIFRQIAIEEIIRKTSKVLSDFTHYTSLVSQPVIRKSCFKHIQFVLLGKNKVCITLVATTGITKSSVLSLDNEIGQERLNRIENIMNSQLENIPLVQLKTKLRRMMIQEKDSLFYVLKEANELMDLSALVDENMRLYFEGIGNILDLPEFEDSEMMRSFVKIFDERKILTEMVKDIIYGEFDQNKVKVLIGVENSNAFLNGCTIVLSSYGVNQQSVGGLGIIGPKRMDYAKVIATVKHVSARLNETLARFSI